MTDVYLAGPLFTPGERYYLEQIDKTCRSLGLTTYLPHRDAGLFSYGIREINSEEFFNKDVDAIKNCKILLAVLNGLASDSGTAWEVGYAYALGKELIGICEDTRVSNPYSNVNLMLACSLKIASSKAELEQFLSEIKRKLSLF